ncbi:MAG: transketolase [Desulfomonile tiedjei]|uniref:Transketolase n=1 Tax=Desulfomonile tiedjei TaxID=2358 RepID=A0A9D6V7G0_9BACT|nr:transketolase [Desulfomonile tiedjei]
MHERELDELCINTLRFLSVDAVQKAKSGHPGLPLGAAPLVYAVWGRFLKFNPRNPSWADRDRFILSAGHGCALLYSVLHLMGFDIPLEELKRFRQWGSRTPGHPEYRKTPGVEATTGPLGQGFANAVGMAMGEASLAARFNRPGYEIVNHFTYAVASDGDLMEGVSYEAASLAGHLRLGKLIVLYDNNHMTIEGETSLAFSEDRLARFAALGWHTQEVADGNDVEALCAAILGARYTTDRPSFISVRTHLGYGSPNKQDTAAAHGEPLGEVEVELTKKNLGWPVEPTFHIPEQALQHFRQSLSRGAAHQKAWEALFREYTGKHPDLASEFQRVMDGMLPEFWDTELPTFSSGSGPIATRSASREALNAIASHVPELIGGAADLAPSTFTLIESSGDFEPGYFSGRNFHFGVREHAMGSIMNGLALHGGFIPYGATFLIFSDYMRPPIRLAALSNLHVIYVFTHDSVGLGEDGPTHQPVEQLLGLRAVPNVLVLRPADANETVAAWKIAVEQRDRPVALVLTRQKIPVLDLSTYPQLPAGVPRGGYTLADAPDGRKPAAILAATGSEVHLALATREKLLDQGVFTRVVSLPSWNLFAEQSAAYREQIFPHGIPIVVIEAGVSLGWKPYVGTGVEVVGVDRFGASAPGEVVMNEYGFTVENICNRVLHALNKKEH